MCPEGQFLIVWVSKSGPDTLMAKTMVNINICQKVISCIFFSQDSVSIELINPQTCSGLFQMALPVMEGDNLHKLTSRMVKVERAIKGRQAAQSRRTGYTGENWRACTSLASQVQYGQLCTHYTSNTAGWISGPKNLDHIFSLCGCKNFHPCISW